MSRLARHWDLDPRTALLNHGSFGATPRAVLRAQTTLRARMESEPVRFMVEELEPLLDRARAALGAFLNARPQDLAFVPNATTAVNAVVNSLALKPGDELLTVSHAYNACLNALRHAADKAGATVIVAPVERAPADEHAFERALLAHATDRTRLAMVCHVTSPTALVLPIARTVAALSARGIDTLVDGAHGPGMLDVDLTAINAAYYTANCHKWICSPKGSAFLHVRADRQHSIRPAVISHGANSRRTDRSRFLLEFDWTGTDDPTPRLCIPEALRAMPAIFHGVEPDHLTLDPFSPPPPINHAGWAAVRAHNRDLALKARRLIAERLGLPLTVPDRMVGSIASIPLPDGIGPQPSPTPYPDPIQRRLIDEFGIQVPISHFPAWPQRSIRVSAQLYNDLSQYERLAEALKACL